MLLLCYCCCYCFPRFTDKKTKLREVAQLHGSKAEVLTMFVKYQLLLSNTIPC